jgi:Ni,Fe-hydrogenase I cytochrome b subunit
MKKKYILLQSPSNSVTNTQIPFDKTCGYLKTVAILSAVKWFAGKNKNLVQVFIKSSQYTTDFTSRYCEISYKMKKYMRLEKKLFLTCKKEYANPLLRVLGNA